MQHKTTIHLQSFRFLWRYIRPHKLELLKSLSAIIVTAATLLSVGFGLRQFVDFGLIPRRGIFFSNPLFLLILFSLIISLAAYIRISSTAWLAEQAVSKMKQDLFHHLIFLPQTFFETVRLGDLLSRFQSDTNQIRMCLST